MENIKEFMELAKEEFMRMIPKELVNNMVIEEATVTKVNDQVLHGLSIKVRDQEPAPTIYMDEAYRRFMSGEDTLKSLMSSAVQEYLDAIAHRPDTILEKFDFDTIKDNLAVRLMEVKRNRQYLSDVPYMLVGNGFAYVCDIKVNSDMNGYWKTTVTRLLSQPWTGLFCQCLSKITRNFPKHSINAAEVPLNRLLQRDGVFSIYLLSWCIQGRRRKRTTHRGPAHHE